MCSISLINASVSPNFFFQDEDGVFYRFTDRLNPEITLNLVSESNSILVIESVKLNNEIHNIQQLPLEIQPFSVDNELVFTIPSSNPNINLLDSDIKVDFEIISSSDEDVTLVGNPTNFFISYINGDTNITSYAIENSQGETTSFDGIQESRILVAQDDSKLTLTLGQDIIQYRVRADSNLVTSSSSSSTKLSELSNTIEIDLSQFTNGVYSFEVFYTTKTGVPGEIISFDLVVLDSPLRITKVHSNKDDSSLGYYFDTRFSNSQVFSSRQNFNFKFETSRPATCYKAQLSNFQNFVPRPAITQQETTHEIPISMDENMKLGVWIMCEDMDSEFREFDRAYLSEGLFDEKKLFSILFLDDVSPIEIVSSEPNGLLTSEPVTVDVTTNTQGVCLYSIEGYAVNDTLQSSQGGTRHVRSNLLASHQGGAIIDVVCFDRLYNLDSVELSINIDSTQDIAITNWRPKLTFTELVDIEVRITDTTATCRVQFDMGSEVKTFQPDSARSQGTTLYFPDVGPFTQEGKNDLILRCETALGLISRNNFHITLDKTQPVINSVRLFNSYTGPTRFFSNTNFMRIEVDSTILDLDYFIVSFENSGILVNSSSSSIIVEENFSLDTSFQIKGVDIYGRETSTFTQVFEIDSQDPQISISQGSSTTQVIITCEDSNSGCHSIKYGLSSSSDNCQAKTLYEEDTEIDVFGKNFICIEAYDEAGNKVTLEQQLGNTPNQDSFTPPTRDDTSTPQPIDDSNDSDSLPIEDDSSSFTPPIDLINPEDPDEFNWILLSAFAFILLLVGAGGYYAYSRGYLDNQLVAIGAKKKSSNDDPYKGVVPYSQIPKKDLNKSQASSAIASSGSSNSKTPNKYDSHLSKLNDFIDSTLKKDSNVFDEFSKDNSKGKTENFKDTLLKNRKSVKDEKESFEDFYKSNKEKQKDKESKSSKK